MSPDFGWDGADAESNGEQSTSEPRLNGTTPDLESEDLVDAPVSIEDYDVERVIIEEFSKEAWDVMEAVLATHATLLLDDIRSSRAIMIEGPSGTGKTMLLKSFNNLQQQFLRRDDVTPASLVSAEPSKDEEALKAADLLPKLEDRTLVVRDAQTWFGGSQEHVESTWRNMASVMDGDGFLRHTGSHGTRGYEDVRFNFVGATTPLEPRAWDVMGNVGQRLLFVEWPEEDVGKDDFKQRLTNGEREPVERAQTAIEECLSDLWEHYGGTESVSWPDRDPDDEVVDGLYYLTQVVRYGRATLHDSTNRADREAESRIGQLLHDLARGNALLHGRRNVEVGDLEVCARVALSTIPARRRPTIRTLLDPSTGDELTVTEVADLNDISKPTARDRMDKLAILNVADVYEKTGRGGTKKVMSPSAEFVWPANLLEFPEIDR